MLRQNFVQPQHRPCYCCRRAVLKKVLVIRYQNQRNDLLRLIDLLVDLVGDRTDDLFQATEVCKILSHWRVRTYKPEELVRPPTIGAV
jgi:hypothetical protein